MPESKKPWRVDTFMKVKAGWAVVKSGDRTGGTEDQEPCPTLTLAPPSLAGGRLGPLTFSCGLFLSPWPLPTTCTRVHPPAQAT